MRIVYMLTSLGVGGAERQVLALADRMTARGHTVALMVLLEARADDLPTDLKVVHLNLRKTFRGLMRGVRQGSGFLRTFRPDILHSHNFHGNVLGRLLHIVNPSPRLVSTIHNVYEGGWLRMTAYRVTDRLAHLTTAVSGAAAERYVRVKAIPRTKCVVLTNGIDTAGFVSNAERRAVMRAHINVTGQFVWITAGRVVPAKDYPNLLRAFGIVVAAWPETQLWIAGAACAPGEARYVELAAELATTKQVRWFGLQTDIAALLDAADGFVLGSAWEGMPLALGEAMAIEKPVVATDVGGVRELVGETGLVVPAKNPQELAGAMLRVMKLSMEERATMGRSARERVRTSFSMDAKAKEWEELYRSLLN